MLRGFASTWPLRRTSSFSPSFCLGPLRLGPAAHRPLSPKWYSSFPGYDDGYAPVQFPKNSGDHRSRAFRNSNAHQRAPRNPRHTHDAPRLLDSRDNHDGDDGSLYHHHDDSTADTGDSDSKSHSTSGQSTFVSSYYRGITEDDMKSFFHNKGLKYRNSGQEMILRECPNCPPHRDRADNMYKLYVSKQSGAYFCHRCGSKGSWFDLKSVLRDGSTSIVKAMEPPSKVLPNQNLAIKMESDVGRTPAGKDVLDYFQKERGITAEMVEKYRIGVASFSFKHPENEDEWVKEPCITFPWIDKHKKTGKDVIQRFKARGIRKKHHMRLVPTGGQWGLFGWHTVPPDATDIVLTEGEFDAMAVHQATGLPAISLPNGARSLPLEVLAMLERFKKITLWMDDDMAGQEGAAKFARKLGVQRCFLVHSRQGDPDGPKDANDALRQGKDIASIIASAKRLPHEEIVTFIDLRNTVHRELTDKDALVGVKSPYFSKMNSIIKGHRKGELTVFSGSTGVGKTTFLSQLSLGYCQAGINTLWGSFEIKNTRLVQKMLCQHTGLSAENLLKDWDRNTESFAELPLYFMRFFGSTNVEKVIEAMEHAAYVYDVEHVILDNLQFMTSGQGTGYHKFDLQDRAIEVFRKFASSANVHVTLVIHPRKEDENVLLNTSSVFGSAKATQEADNVLILQRGLGRFKRLDVKKNRFDGELGNVFLEFDRETNRYKEVTSLISEEEFPEDSTYLNNQYS